METKIRKVLFNEISLFISVVAFIIGCVLFVSKPDAEMRQNIALIQQQIQTMEENHLSSIEDDIDEIKEINKEQGEVIQDIQLKLERILTLLEQ